MSAVPLRTPRLVSLLFMTAIGTVGMSLGINALVKSIDQKHTVQKFALPGSTVSIDDSDVLSSGAVVTVACGLLALTSFLSIPFLFVRFPRSRSLTLLSALFAFLTVMLFATLVPFTSFIATRQAKVSAFLGNTPIPQATIQALQNALGVTPIYHEIDYLKNAAILQWIAFFFAVITTILTLRAARIARASAAASSPAFMQQRDGSSTAVNEKESSTRKSKESKESEERTEVVENRV